MFGMFARVKLKFDSAFEDCTTTQIEHAAGIVRFNMSSHVKELLMRPVVFVRPVAGSVHRSGLYRTVCLRK
jgi:hypothetical protein